MDKRFSTALFGQGRRSILSLLYGHADEQFYLREIARRSGTGIGATHKSSKQEIACCFFSAFEWAETMK